MNEFARLAQRVERSLELTIPPVAVTFRDNIPTGVEAPSAPVPAGCSFWELGARMTVATNAEHHKHCSIGVYTHNLADAPNNQQHELEATLSVMQGLDYVRPSEVEALPVMTNRSKQVVYGPLHEATERPSIVLLFARAYQGLILSEALTRVDGETPTAMGRPACALIPQVLNSSRSASSLGCCGARAYLDALSDDIALWGLSGAKFEAYVDEIESLAKANSVLSQYHGLRRAAIESGEAPTVEQSLARLK